MLLTCVNSEGMRDNLTHLRRYSMIKAWENTGKREIKVIDDNGQPFYFDASRFMPTHFEVGMQFISKRNGLIYTIDQNKGDSIVVRPMGVFGVSLYVADHYEIEEMPKYFEFWPKVS